MKFIFRTPDGIKFLKTNKNMTDKDRFNLFMDVIYKKYEKWLNKNKHTYAGRKLLFDCANFLLKNTNKKTTLTPSKIKKINSMEIPLSSIKNKIYDDLFYSNTLSYDMNNEQFYFNKDKLSFNHRNSNNHILKTNTDLKEANKYIANQEKRFEHTKTYRINKLYSTKKIRTYRVEPIKSKQMNVINKDGVSSSYIDTSKSNIFGHPIVDAVYYDIGGHKGIIDLGENYIAEWCLVDTDNIFSFRDYKYKISNKVKQYEVKNDNKANMDKILCIYSYDKNKYYFFDQNIFPIQQRYIKQLT